MPIVSSVIYNRLKRKIPLQMDGTLNYGEYSNSIVTAMRIKRIIVHIILIKNRGIPKNPVCASLDAIKAAIFCKKQLFIFCKRQDNWFT